ncbi:MAG: glycosyltransferase family 39 protein [Planctomycetia bacterium]|nr:glycosyltransferase family 39 protein [Planctomycetia bacterium]
MSWQASLNRTEVGHLGAAVYFYETARGDVFCVNPPLAKIITGLPVRLMSPKYDWKSYSPRPQDRAEWSLGATFVNANTDKKIRVMLFVARLALLPFILLGVWFGWKLAAGQYGRVSAMMFLALWMFSPLVLAWTATICPDVLAAAFGLIGFYTFLQWLKAPNLWNVGVAGFTLGLMILTKLTWIVAVPIYVVIWLLWRYIPDAGVSIEEESICDEKRTNKKARLKELVLVFFVAVYILNMGYLFDGTFTQLKEYKFMSEALSSHQVDEEHTIVRLGNRFDGSGSMCETVLGYLPLPFPKDFIQGIDTQKYDFERGIESYLNGHFSHRGWKSYYIYVLLYKEPIAFLLLFLIAAGMTFFPKYRLRKEEIVIIVPLILLFVFISFQEGISVHPRYILPCYPFAYLFISRTGLLFSKQKTSLLLRYVVVILLLWGITSSVFQYPHSMSYFNEFIRPKNGARYLQGSNVDWGQNHYYLQSWCNSHPDITLRTNYLTDSDITRLGIKNIEYLTDFRREDLSPGWYAIGVCDLYGKSEQYQVFQQFEPTEWIANTICIYHLTQEQLDKVKEKGGHNAWRRGSVVENFCVNGRAQVTK